MFTVSKTFSFCYGHRLMGDEGKCRHLHGHAAKATFTLGKDDLDEMGMVVHFDRLKEGIGGWIDENLDHAMLLCEADPATKMLANAGERFFPMKANPTAENIARLLYDMAKGLELPVISVEVCESDTARACYSV